MKIASHHSETWPGYGTVTLKFMDVLLLQNVIRVMGQNTRIRPGAVKQCRIKHISYLHFFKIKIKVKQKQLQNHHHFCCNHWKITTASDSPMTRLHITKSVCPSKTRRHSPVAVIQSLAVQSWTIGSKWAETQWAIYAAWHLSDMEIAPEKLTCKFCRTILNVWEGKCKEHFECWSWKLNGQKLFSIDDRSRKSSTSHQWTKNSPSVSGASDDLLFVGQHEIGHIDPLRMAAIPDRWWFNS